MELKMAYRLDEVIAGLKAIREHNGVKGTAEVLIVDGSPEQRMFANEETQAKISDINVYDEDCVFVHIER
jgi:hypothetical protein